MIWPVIDIFALFQPPAPRVKPSQTALKQVEIKPPRPRGKGALWVGTVMDAEITKSVN